MGQAIRIGLIHDSQYWERQRLHYYAGYILQLAHTVSNKAHKSQRQTFHSSKDGPQLCGLWSHCQAPRSFAQRDMFGDIHYSLTTVNATTVHAQHLREKDAI